MRKSLVTSLLAACVTLASSSHAALVFDFNGADPGGEQTITNFDWGPSTYLAINGNKAVADYLNDPNSYYIGSGPGDPNYNPNGTKHEFTGYLMAKMNNNGEHIPAGMEITMVASFTEFITDVTTSFNRFGQATGDSTAFFQTTGVGWIQIYYGPSDSSSISGSGYTDGKLILSAQGVTGLNGGASTGSFVSYAAQAPVLLDQFGSNNYGATQKTIAGVSDQSDLLIGTSSRELDTDYFKTTLTGFSMQFSNLTMRLPFTSADPSNCFAITPVSTQVGDVNTVPSCSANFSNGQPYSGQSDANGYTPNIGSVNGRLTGSYALGFTAAAPDLVASADINSAVSGFYVSTSVPEPTTLALLGLGMLGLGFSLARRRG